VTLGRHGIFTAEKARATAQQLLAAMAAGENPNLKRRERLAQGIAVAEAIDFAVEPLPPSEADRVPYISMIIGIFQ